MSRVHLAAAVARAREQGNIISPAELYGEFRACWTGRDGHAHSFGEGLGWNESTATNLAEKMGESGSPRSWVEHQDPQTKEWKVW